MAGRRDEWTAREWRERLQRFRRSDLSVASFCEREGVSTSSFYVWKRRLKSDRTGSADGASGRRAACTGASRLTASARTSAKRTTEPLFVPVSFPSAAAPELRIELAGGAIVYLPAGAPSELVRTCIRAAAEPRSLSEETRGC